jgi:hypothetical protein
MKSRYTIAQFLAATSAALLVVVTIGACGQSSTPSTSPTPTPTPSPTPTPTPSPTPNPSCTITMNPTTQSVPIAGGAFFSGVTASTTDCPWKVGVDSSWIVIGSGLSGKGSGTVTYTIPQNNDFPRTGMLTVTAAASSASVAIAQLGTDCSFTLSPSAQSVGASGGAFQFSATRNTVNGCSWSATTATPWLTLTGATSGLSPATINYSAGVNSTGADRTGAISVVWHGGSADFVVAQIGR